MIYLSYFQLFCTPELYDREAPTKQNLLCNNKSPMEIVSQHPLNTYASSNSTAGTPLFAPSFRYVSHQTTLYILVLDRSAQMGKKGRWTNLHNALHG